MKGMVKRGITFVLTAAVMLGFGGLGQEAYGATVSENARGTSVVRYLGAGSDGAGWNNPHYSSVKQFKYAIKAGGEEKYGYCFQSKKGFKTGYSYTAKRVSNASAWTNLSAAKQNLMKLIMFYGYNNGKSVPVSGANVNDYYAATQVLMWEASDGDISLSAAGVWSKASNEHDNLIAGRSGATSCYNWMRNKIANHVKGPSFAGKSYSGAKTHVMKYDYATGKWTCRLTDGTKANYYAAASGTSGGLAMSRSGYTYTFTTAAAGNKSLVLQNSGSSGTSQPLMVFKPSNSGMQSIVIGAEDTTRFYANFRTEKEGTGTIIKTTSDGSSAEGFAFLVENKSNGYSAVHKTDSSGKISLNLYPGTYTVTEQLTEEQKEDGFLNPVASQLVISEGKASSVSFENVRTLVPFEIKKTSDNNVVDGFEFVIRNEEGNEVVRQKTAADGKITGQLVPGKYFVSEELTEEQLMDGYRGGKEQTLVLKPAMSLRECTVSFHNLWEPIEGKIAVRKMTDDGGPVGGFHFDITGRVTATGEAYEKLGCETDETGQYLTEEMEPGTYTITERLTDSQKIRYHEAEPQTVEIKEPGQGVIVNFENKARTTAVELEKTSEDGVVAGVEFVISGTYQWGEAFEEIRRTTDEEGRLTVNLQPGNYSIKEAENGLEGYVPQPAQEFTVTGDQQPVQLKFINIPYALTLTKTEVLENGMATDTPVEGAVYDVYRADDSGGDSKVFYGRYTTDEDGSFTVTGASPGTYIFREAAAPKGYEIEEEPVTVEFNAEDVSLQIDASNNRALGTILVQVVDDKGNPVEGNEVGIFLDEGCTQPIEKYVTDETGRVKIEDLVWGDYYIKETTGTRGFHENNEIRHIEIGKDGVIDGEYVMVKQQKKGKVTLLKTDDTETVPLAGAAFELYKSDGTLVETGCVTDDNGLLEVEGLDWGSYFFREIKAPEGYSLSSDPVQFSVNATTGGVAQQLVVPNKPEACGVLVTKKILASDIHYDHGVPTFTFVLEGTDVDGLEHTYRQQVTFSEEFVEANTGADGYVTATAAFGNVKAGTYTCREQPVSRYKLAQVTGVSANGTVDEGGSVVFNLEGLTWGEATFINEKKDWRDYTDTTVLTNILKAEKKLTAIAVEYPGPETLDGNMPFDGNEMLEVTAFYDDGSERALNADEYLLLNGDGSEFVRTEKTAGEYTVTVQYTEGSRTCRGNFSFNVKAAEEVTVTFETDGGTELAPLTVWKYDSLADYPAENYTAEKMGYGFAGWFTDADCQEAFAVTEPVRGDMTLYAGWEKKHLNDFTWEEIQEISLAGKAPELLGECYETIKGDLADDGVISAENYIHMKAFDSQGTGYHAMIAGFDHDVKTDGTTAGISFIVYEPAAAAPMIVASTGRTLGWESSYMRNTVLAQMFEGLPDSLQQVICPVNKVTGIKKNSAIEMVTTGDRLWLPSQVELYGAWGYDDWASSVTSANYMNLEYGNLLSIAGEGAQYPLFAGAVPDGIEQAEGALAAGSSYWTRSVVPSMDRGFCIVDGAGAAGSQ